MRAADIVALCSPIWLGEKSSVCTQASERLYGVKYCAMNILYSLQHPGYSIPPQADAGWMGEAGPGSSYLDAGSGGPESGFTNRKTTFRTWNLLHIARLMKDARGFSVRGNQRALLDAGCGFDVANPSTASRRRTHDREPGRSPIPGGGSD